MFWKINSRFARIIAYRGKHASLFSINIRKEFEGDEGNTKQQQVITLFKLYFFLLSSMHSYSRFKGKLFSVIALKVNTVMYLSIADYF